MFFLLLASPLIALIILGIVGQIVNNKKNPSNEGGWCVFSCVMAVFTVIVLGIGLIFSLGENSSQIENSFELDKITQVEKTYQARADILAKKFAGYLLEAYPQHEKDIFSKIEPGKLDVYLVKYPELQASKTILALVDQERSLQDDIYKQRVARAEKIKDMRYRNRSPWIFQFLMPSGITVPSE